MFKNFKSFTIMKYLILSIMLIVPTFLNSQMLPGGLEEEEYSHRNQKSKDESRLYADYRLGAPLINKKVGLEMGFDFGSTFGGNYFMGFGMHTLISKNIEYDFEGEVGTPFLRMSHIGMQTGYNIDLSDLLYITPSAEFAMSYISYGTNSSIDISTDYNGQWGFSIMPKVALGYAVGGSTFLEVQAAYRFMSGFDFGSVSNSDLESAVIALSIKTYL